MKILIIATLLLLTLFSCKKIEHTQKPTSKPKEETKQVIKNKVNDLPAPICKDINFTKQCWIKSSNQTCYMWNQFPETVQKQTG